MPWEDDLNRVATGHVDNPELKDIVFGHFALNMAQAFVLGTEDYFEKLVEFEAYYARFITMVSLNDSIQSRSPGTGCRYRYSNTTHTHLGRPFSSLLRSGLDCRTLSS
jgi:hypothetical protein